MSFLFPLWIDKNHLIIIRYLNIIYSLYVICFYVDVLFFICKLETKVRMLLSFQMILDFLASHLWFSLVTMLSYLLILHECLSRDEISIMSKLPKSNLKIHICEWESSWLMAQIWHFVHHSNLSNDLNIHSGWEYILID